MKGVGQTIVGKGELATALNVSRPTLDALIADEPDFPIRKRGGPGVAWEFDLHLVRAFLEVEGREFRHGPRSRRAQQIEVIEALLGVDLELKMLKLQKQRATTVWHVDLAECVDLALSEVRRFAEKLITKVSAELRLTPAQCDLVHELVGAGVRGFQKDLMLLPGYRKAADVEDAKVSEL